MLDKEDMLIKHLKAQGETKKPRLLELQIGGNGSGDRNRTCDTGLMSPSLTS
ncbi:hypothetical protein [Dictyobacter kobayashii]|uniref:Uncharacterized protein n=1 Tax=Dictyobacter kobayashii TaxID=2014872 RepID=A0A402AIT6_9CHLR|nr:hypothetical protein [Dictyobacter kobayashii]GCE18983.1 hypothetical protein KDK_27830 [Dictyobacter kobayashii]